MPLKNMRKWEDIITFVVLLQVLILLNILAQNVTFQLDFTEEKRYTLSEASQKVLAGLDDDVYVEVFLDGELNGSFQQFQRAIRENLQSFQAHAGSRLRYSFVNPEDIADEETRSRFYEELSAKGLPPTTLFEDGQTEKKQKLIVPGALISYKNKEKGVLLLKGNSASTNPSEEVSASIENIEFELISAIQTLTAKRKPSVAYIDGHEELRVQDVFDVFNSFSDKYVLERVNLNQRNLDGYSAVIVAQPKNKFSERERYRLDQFLMNGGKALFLIDAVQMNLDSIPLGGTYAFGHDLQIEDMLFRYGVRVNMDLVQDRNMGAILLNVGKFGDKPNIQPVRFPYHSVLNSFAKHPLTKGLDAVYLRFYSSIDTVKAKGIRKTPLLFTSDYSRIKRCPNLIDLDEVKKDMTAKDYTRSGIPVAYLLEGKFKSVYAGIFPPEGEDRQVFKQEAVVPTKIVVVSDGDLIRNELNPRTREPLPLGFDPISRQTFSNKDFLSNILAYLTDENGLVSSRNKELKMRPLDTFRIQESKTLWQVLNILGPILLVCILGGIRFYWRKQKNKNT
ncbi:MAG: gliding motility-associated ABC transporter substrate-binding protein GldG [Cytophagales bacterium]|nr:MAG: gliding motility-associated ABC transporter substrate-binding protein GldG [Cytophagales bacterium]TAF61747.1 MAG: gliding motility-associated ABC transporter substrate-binding protein GldG [Cytophagales bacterium]